MIFFRFPDQETGMAELRSKGFTIVADDGSEQVINATHEWAVDVVGTITRGGKYDEDGKVLVKPTVLPGFHVNFAGTLPDGWDEFLVEPVAPVRVFA